jgi:DNA-binding MurR/RpiR family transcriptional regulator
VLRFVARLGFESYPEFQRVLRNDVQAQLMSPLERARTTGPDIDNPALKASFASVTANLAATLRAVPESEFEAACDLLSDHKSACYLLGGRFTDTIAAYMAAHLQIIRPNVRHFDGQTSTWQRRDGSARPTGFTADHAPGIGPSRLGHPANPLTGRFRRHRLAQTGRIQYP